MATAAHNWVNRVYKINGVYVVFAARCWAGKNPNHYAASYVKAICILSLVAQVAGWLAVTLA
jgi:hypothetical protein